MPNGHIYWLLLPAGRDRDAFLDALRARGVESEVLTSAYKGSPDQTHDGIRVHRFRYFAARWARRAHG